MPDEFISVSLVPIAPQKPKKASAPEPPKPEPEPAAEPEPPPKPEPEVKPEPEPEPEPEPKVVKKSASDLRKMLAQALLKKRTPRREPTPTKTPRRRSEAVPTVAPIRVPTSRPRQVSQPKPARPAAGDSSDAPVTIEGPAGRYDFYLSAIRNTLWRNWTVPQLPGVQKYSMIVRITIGKNGRVSDYNVRQRSGNTFFDQSILDAITTSRFPQFPDDYKDSGMTVTVRFRPEM